MKRVYVFSAVFLFFLGYSVLVYTVDERLMTEKKVVRVAQGTSLGPRVLPVLLAEDEGFLATEGLKLEFVVMPQAGPTALVVALAKGHIDFELDNGGFLPAIEKGMPIVFRDALGRWPAHFIARPGYKLRDISGKVVLSHLVISHGQIRGLKAILKNRGISTLEVQHIYDPMIIIDMLKNPRYKGVYNFAFFTNRLTDAEDAGLVTLIDYFDLNDAKVANYLIERKDLDPGISRGFYRAFWKAMRFINDPKNKDRVINYVVKYKIEKDAVMADKLYKDYLLQVLMPRGLKVSDAEFIEFAKWFGVEIPKDKIRKFYEPMLP